MVAIEIKSCNEGCIEKKISEIQEISDQKYSEPSYTEMKEQQKFEINFKPKKHSLTLIGLLWR